MNKYANGADAEQLVLNLFESHNYYTTGTQSENLFPDGAPLLSSQSDKLRVPDFHALGHGDSFWIEVKQKAEVIETIVRSQKEHGIDSPNYSDYKQIADISGVPVWVFIFEEPTGKLLAGRVNRLSELDPIDATRCRQDYGNIMTYIPRHEFEQVRITDSQIPAELSLDIETQKGKLLPVIIQNI